MTDKKKIQKSLFIISCLNCCLIVILISISLSTDQWVIVKPIRKVSYEALQSKPMQSNSILDSNFENYKESLPIDLHGRIGCERFKGKIK